MAKRTFTSATADLSCISLIGVIGCGFEIHVVSAQEAGSVTVEVGECVNLQSPEERFACYERQVDAARTAPIPAAPNPIAEPANAGAASSEPSNQAAAPAAAAATAPAAEATESQEFTATVTEVRETVPNKLLITLDNGQVWRQTYAEWYPLRPGLKVRIRPSRWGGTFSLTTDEHKGFIQVRRVE